VPSSLSWSPDGERITYQTDSAQADPSRFEPTVKVVDLTTGKAWSIGAGRNPAWSPSGQWIAYLDSAGNRAVVVHPDGSGTRTLTTARGNFWGVRGRFFLVPVWSPDSSRLLVNELLDPETLQTDVLLFDIANGKLVKKFSKRTAVLGWAEAK
jgi:Tol biopolymer transport system component